MWPFKVFGAALVSVSLCCDVAVYANRFARHAGGHNLLPLLVPAALMAIVGIGLMQDRFWAAAVFAIGCLGVGA